MGNSGDNHGDGKGSNSDDDDGDGGGGDDGDSMGCVAPALTRMPTLYCSASSWCGVVVSRVLTLLLFMWRSRLLWLEAALLLAIVVGLG